MLGLKPLFFVRYVNVGSRRTCKVLHHVRRKMLSVLELGKLPNPCRIQAPRDKSKYDPPMSLIPEWSDQRIYSYTSKE